MKRVYVAGAYSADNIIQVFTNMRLGIALSLRVLKAGFAPFCPWLDYQFALKEQMSLKEYYDYSMAWLEASDAVLVQTIGAEKSHGTLKEIRRARELNIPVFNSLENLCQWNSRFYEKQNS